LVESTDSGQNADDIMLGTAVTNSPTGGTSTSLSITDKVRNGIQEAFDRLKDLSGVQNDAVDSRHIHAGAIDLEHMSSNSVDSNQYVDGSIDRIHLSADIIDSTKLANDSVGNEHYKNDSISQVHLKANSVDSEQYVDTIN